MMTEPKEWTIHDGIVRHCFMSICCVRKASDQYPKPLESLPQGDKESCSLDPPLSNHEYEPNVCGGTEWEKCREYLT